MKETLRVGIGRDQQGWHTRFQQVFEAKIRAGWNLEYDLINFERHDWQKQIASRNLILWKPDAMGVKAASFVKEKVYFMEHYLGKLVIPNFNTVWHFESKIAQSYLFAQYDVPTPETVVSFDYEDARKLLASAEFPVVIKGSAGAGSQNVKLYRSSKEAVAELDRAFSQVLWDKLKARFNNRLMRAIVGTPRSWFRHHLMKPSEDRRFGALYLQRYVSGNEADLRITVIGHSAACSFWRNNRPSDFRASGSGRLDYQRKTPEDMVRYCMQLNQKLDVDSMAYDLLLSGDRYVITEMSYGYLDSAVAKTGGYYTQAATGELSFVNKSTWPQELWAEWALSRAQSAGLLE